MKHLIRQNFSQAVSTYNEFGKPQYLIAADFAKQLASLDSPKSILEIGCGTGFLTASLQGFNCPLVVSDFSPEMVINLNIQGGKPVVFDAEYFPFATSFDWIVSSLCFQWLEDPLTTLRNLKDHCNTLAFTTLGNRNFFEWSEFCEQHQLENRIRKMLSADDLRAILGRNIYIKETYYPGHHPNWLSFWDHIHKIGAHTSLKRKNQMIPNNLLKSGPITCSYHVLTVIVK